MLSRTLLSSLLVALFAIVGLPACGDDPPAGGNSGNNGSTNDDSGVNDFNIDDAELLERYDEVDDAVLLTALIGEVACQGAWNCPGANDQTAFWATQLGRFTSASECIDFAIDEMAPHDLRVEERRAIEEGRIVIDRDYLEECRDSMLEHSCQNGLFDDMGFEDDWDREHPCARLYAGQFEEGDHCITGAECRGDLSCSSAETDDDACYGVCTSGSDTVLGSCGDQECEPDEYCDFSGEENSCQPRGGEGDECSTDSQCMPSLFCSDDEVCSSISIREEGDDCAPGYDFCGPATSCRQSEGGVCRPVGQEGDACQAMEDCRWDLACVGAGDDAGECARPDIGDECSDSLQCTSGHCDMTTDECSPFAELGEECTSSHGCAGDAVCEEGECTEFSCQLPDDG